MILTEEQEEILEVIREHVENKKDLLLKVESVAGSGKTSILIENAKLLGLNTHNLYLAYNKSRADDAQSKFPTNTECRTTHSLAYEPIIKYGLTLSGEKGSKRTISLFTARSITEEIPYETKVLIVKNLDKFFLSDSVDVKEYFKEDTLVNQLCKNYFDKMVSNSMAVPHSFYLKMFHILLAEDCITYDPFDSIMLDEAGDINPVTLEIFQLLPSKIKIIVGDSQQNIYSFNNTIDGFERLKDVGINKTLSQSFRCSPAIANIVEPFCQKHLNPTMNFIGTENDGKINTIAYISRTNSGLIRYAIDFTKEKTPFKLVRSPYEIFKLVLALISLSNGKTPYEAEFKYLEEDQTKYNSSTELQRNYKSFHQYLEYLYDSDKSLKASIKLMKTHRKSEIFNAYNYAKNMAKLKIKSNITLTTAHSSKGLMWDSVTLADDFNLDDTLKTPRQDREPSEQEELRLYYVAVTRARVEVKNIEYLYK